MQTFLALALAALSQDAEFEKGCREIAETIQKEFAKGDSKALDAALDIGLLGERATKNVDAPAKFREGFIEGLREGRFGEQVLASAKGGSYTFLRLKTDGGATRALFRLLGPNGVNYHELVFERRAREIRIADVFIYISGESYADAVRRIYIRAAAEANKGLADKLEGADRLLLENFQLITKMSEQVRENQPKAALQSYAALPESLQKEKVVMILRLTAARGAGEEAYGKAIQDFERLFPRDTALDLVSFDGYCIQKKWDDAIKALDRLDQRVNDPYLEILRGNVLFQAGQHDKSKEAFGRAVKADPSLLDAWWALVQFSLTEKNWKETTRLLLFLERERAVEIGDLVGVEAYKEFVSTEEYAAWMKERKKK